MEQRDESIYLSSEIVYEFLSIGEKLLKIHLEASIFTSQTCIL